jgi:hypothetical protein
MPPRPPPTVVNLSDHWANTPRFSRAHLTSDRESELVLISKLTSLPFTFPTDGNVSSHQDSLSPAARAYVGANLLTSSIVGG